MAKQAQGLLLAWEMAPGWGPKDFGFGRSELRSDEGRRSAPWPRSPGPRWPSSGHPGCCDGTEVRRRTSVAVGAVRLQEA
jgi:hypothetical protein